MAFEERRPWVRSDCRMRQPSSTSAISGRSWHRPRLGCASAAGWFSP